MKMTDAPLHFRYRTNWCGKVILQVLVKSDLGSVYVNEGSFPGCYARWRDATAGDITRSDTLSSPK